jgi:putative peptidoglycan lipid II flippase
VASAAVLIAGLTAASRLVGLVRTLVFAGTVGPTELGDLYQTANTVPNIVYEIVVGGALAVAVVPVVAPPIARADPVRVGQLTSALLTWTVLLLAPLAAAVAIAAPTIVVAFTGDPAGAGVGALMLRIFAVQIPLYGVGIVLTGVLNAHRRYAWPVIAPLLSSLTVIITCLAFSAVAGRAPRLDSVGPGAVVLLAAGTTVGVAVLTLCLLVPVWALGLRLRPRLRLEPAIRRQLLALGGASAVIVVAQELATLWLIRLANGGPTGSVVLLSLAQKVALVPSALLALPLSIAAYPQLARAAVVEDRAGFDATLARATRWVLLGAGLGVAGLVSAAPLLGRLLVGATGASVAASVLASAIAAFAPGLFGLGLLAVLTRGLSAVGAAGRAAAWVVIGWSVGSAVAVLAVRLDHDTVSALGVASSVGLSVLGAGLLGAVWRRRGATALAGCGRTVLLATFGAVLGGGLGWWAASAVPVLGPIVGLATYLVVTVGLVVAVGEA